MHLQQRPDLRFLSELYATDAPGAVLLAEYPSSNSDETIFRNRDRYIIHDPFPPPRRELLKVLGPHHLMCGWGRDLRVSSEVSPQEDLTAHWERMFGPAGCPQWESFDGRRDYITLFPHESVTAERQVINPEILYPLHSKEVIGQIDCPQPRVLDGLHPPCVAKLSHGYAGLGNFYIRSRDEETRMKRRLDKEWPGAVCVVTELIERIQEDMGVQFYVCRDGSLVWLGVTHQQFDDRARWCGGTFDLAHQDSTRDEVGPIVESVGRYLHTAGYFGVVGVDIVRDGAGRLLVVDINPRLTGISPFLMASRLFAADGLTEGVYRASCPFRGSLPELIQAVENIQDARVLVLSAFEDTDRRETLCHLSATSDSQDCNSRILDQITNR